MSWKAIHKKSGLASIISNEQKDEWQQHPAVKGLYTYEKSKEKVTQPVETLNEGNQDTDKGQGKAAPKPKK